MATAITPAAATVTRASRIAEAARHYGDVCVINGARVYAADNAGTGADAEQARTWAAL